MQPVTPGLQTAQLELSTVPQSGKRERNLNHQEQIYACIAELHNLGRVASRQRVADMLDLKLSIVDSHIKTLKDNGRIVFVVNGIYEPAAQHEQDRAMTLTGLPGGKVKLEVGDDMLDLTPSEMRRLATMARGWAIESTVIESDREGRNDRSRLDRIEDLLDTAARKIGQIEQATHTALNGGGLFGMGTAP